MTSTSDLRAYLRWGNPDAICYAIRNLPDAERATLAMPLLPDARAITQATNGEHGEAWEGPRTSAHAHAAQILLSPTLDHVLTTVPSDQDFITRSMPILFEDNLSQILTAWADTYVKNPKNEELVDSILLALNWLDVAEVRLPVNQAVTLLLLTGCRDVSRLYSHLSGGDYFTYSLIKSAFHVPGLKYASLEHADSGCLHANSIGGFLIPALIHNGTLTQTEVLEWCDHAISMKERTNHDKAWFTRVRAYLASTEIPVLPDTPEQWWLEPRERLTYDYRDIQAGIAHPEITDNADLRRLMPLTAFLEQCDWGGFTMNVGDYCRLNEHATLDGAQQALSHLGLDHAASLIQRAVTHWETHHKPALDRNEFPADEVSILDQDLENEWLEISDEVEDALNAAIEAGWTTGTGN